MRTQETGSYFISIIYTGFAVVGKLNDHWNLDHSFERLLVDTVVAPDPDEVAWINPRIEPGAVRKVLTGIPGKTGLGYTLDRERPANSLSNPDRHAERHQRHRRRDRSGDRERRGGLQRLGTGVLAAPP